jgi:carboxymethylenebutenolidase
MKIRLLAITILVVPIAAIVLLRVARPPAVSPSPLPTQSTAKTILNTTHRHREWVSVPFASTSVWTFIVYPERSDKAPVVVITESGAASDWIRAVGDHVAAQGYIAAVPEISSEAACETVRKYALSLPAANGKSASLEFARIADAVRVDVTVGSTARKQRAQWSDALAFLNQQTENRPIFGANPNIAEDHSAHIAMAMAQSTGAGAQAGRGFGGRGYPTGKLAELPAGIFTAKNTLANSKLRKEFVDIPVGNVKLHTWIEYPEGEGKAPVIIVMQHGPGLDDWQRALADQLALHGFIAIAPDLFSGLGPNGGNYDSFSGPDDVLRANARLPQDEGIRRYKAAYEYGMKLPRANGKSGTVGFCAGGGYSFRFAGEVPEVNAAVVYYGTPPSEEIMAKIKAPVLGFYGEDDARVTSTVEPAMGAMKKLGKSYEPHIYAHGTHGFLEYQDVGGNPAATSDSWARTIAFLNQHTK